MNMCTCSLTLKGCFHFSRRIHSWGDSLEEAFEQCTMGMFGYMTDTETVEPIDAVEVESEGGTVHSTFSFQTTWDYKRLLYLTPHTHSQVW